MNTSTHYKLTICISIVMSVITVLSICEQMQIVATAAIAAQMTILSTYIWCRTVSKMTKKQFNMKLTILLLQLAIIALLLYQLKKPAIRPVSATTRVLKLEQNRLSPDLLKQLDSLRIPAKRVVEVRHTAGITRQTITTQLRDSVVRDTVKVRVFSYADRYMRMEGMAKADTQQVRIAITDTLLQVVHKGRRKYPWLWVFSPRELWQTVKLANPNASITYDRQIRVSD